MVLNSVNATTGRQILPITADRKLLHSLLLFDLNAADDMARAQNLGRSGVCNMTCPGNSSQTCGGAWGMQVYRFNTRPADDGTHAGTTPAEPEPTTNAGTQVTQETSSGSSGGPSQLVDGSNSNTAAAAAGVATSQEYSAAGQTGAAVVTSLLLAGTGYLATSLLT